MLKIRLQRVGRKHEPSFRLVLTDSKNSTKSGRYIETLGSYDARRGEKSEFKDERINYWMSKGAKASLTVHNLLVSKKVLSAKKLNALPLKNAIVKEGEAVAPATAEVSEVKTETVAEPKEETKVEETTTEEKVEETA
jgi:small subunit ribosomal protein S16